MTLDITPNVPDDLNADVTPPAIDDDSCDVTPEAGEPADQQPDPRGAPPITRKPLAVPAEVDLWVTEHSWWEEQFGRPLVFEAQTDNSTICSVTDSEEREWIVKIAAEGRTCVPEPLMGYPQPALPGFARVERHFLFNAMLIAEGHRDSGPLDMMDRHCAIMRRARGVIATELKGQMSDDEVTAIGFWIEAQLGELHKLQLLWGDAALRNISIHRGDGSLGVTLLDIGNVRKFRQSIQAEREVLALRNELKLLLTPKAQPEVPSKKKTSPSDHSKPRMTAPTSTGAVRFGGIEHRTDLQYLADSLSRFEEQARTYLSSADSVKDFAGLAASWGDAGHDRSLLDFIAGQVGPSYDGDLGVLVAVVRQALYDVDTTVINPPPPPGNGRYMFRGRLLTSSTLRTWADVVLNDLDLGYPNSADSAVARELFGQFALLEVIFRSSANGPRATLSRVVDSVIQAHRGARRLLLRWMPDQVDAEHLDLLLRASLTLENFSVAAMIEELPHVTVSGLEPVVVRAVARACLILDEEFTPPPPRDAPSLVPRNRWRRPRSARREQQ